MARSLSSEKIAEKKAELIETAIEILEKEGLQSLTLRHLADSAGMSRTTPYLYFSSKDALLNGIRTHCIVNLTQSCHAVITNGEKSIEQIRQLGQVYILFGLNHPELYDLIFMTCVEPEKSGSAELYDAIKEYGRVTSTPMIVAYEQGLVSLPPERLNPVLWSASHGLLSLRRIGHIETDADFDRILEDLGQIISAGFIVKK